MQFSIIIPTYNRTQFLKSCLERLAPDIQGSELTNYEVIVTDDSNLPTSKTLVAERFPWVKWVAGPGEGPAANRNSGAKAGTGKWLIFLDDDCLPDKGLLKGYREGIEKNPNTEVFEGCIQSERPQRNLIEESPINTEGGYLWSCNFMIIRKIFNQVNGFDPGFPYPAMEDVDLHYRLRQSNIKIYFLQSAMVIHPWRLRKNIITVDNKRFKSMLYFLNKHPELRERYNSRYYFRMFYTSLIKVTLMKSFSFRFRGFFPKVLHDLTNLYYSLYLVVTNLRQDARLGKNE